LFMFELWHRRYADGAPEGARAAVVQAV
jgi:hypothetical protein